jgi:hypothetical protein
VDRLETALKTTTRLGPRISALRSDPSALLTRSTSDSSRTQRISVHPRQGEESAMSCPTVVSPPPQTLVMRRSRYRSSRTALHARQIQTHRWPTGLRRCRHQRCVVRHQSQPRGAARSPRVLRPTRGRRRTTGMSEGLQSLSLRHRRSDADDQSAHQRASHPEPGVGRSRLFRQHSFRSGHAVYENGDQRITSVAPTAICASSAA